MIFSAWLTPNAGKDLGAWGEERAAEAYRQKGFRIFDKNFFNRTGKRLGEIDLIAVKDVLIVFVEVKTRTSDRFGTPAESVGEHKQRRILKACKLFLLQNPQFSDYNQRIDVVEILADIDRKVKSVNIIENAIEDSR